MQNIQNFLETTILTEILLTQLSDYGYSRIYKKCFSNIQTLCNDMLRGKNWVKTSKKEQQVTDYKNTVFSMVLEYLIYLSFVTLLTEHDEVNKISLCKI